ncbi:UPF0184 protein [Parasteatoda tepidariorum]|uniref:UPF0184 protein n=1 Tax=Parasteatoda tepidariorum TaxID=114398 RepID=UPI00077F85EC|nr:UPF0184 protein [Parasteatoda tepidariorum]
MTPFKKESDEPPEENIIDNVPIEELSLQDVDLEAYQQLSNELDEINNCLDALERKNDSLNEELFKLLEESKQIRSELQEAASNMSNDK